MIILISGKQEIPKFDGYKEFVNYEDVGDTSELDDPFTAVYSEVFKVDFDLSAGSNVFVLQNDNVSLIYSGKLYTNQQYFFGTGHNGVAAVNLTFRFSEGTVFSKEYSATTLENQHVITIPTESDLLEEVMVNITPLQGMQFPDSKDLLADSGKVQRLSTNTVKTADTGILECYDRYNNVVDNLAVEKGEIYVVSAEAVRYSLLSEELP